jgi:hypothetical protein
MTYTAKAYFKHGHGDDPVLIDSPEDLDGLIDTLLTEPFAHSIAALYVNERPLTNLGLPDHEVRIAVDEDGKVGGFRYIGDGASWYVAGQQSQRDEVFYYYQGSDEGFPRDSEITLDVLRATTKEFLALGGARPVGVEWVEWPKDLV